MNLTHHHLELRGAARLIPTALSFALIAGACTTALAFHQQVTGPQLQTPAANPTPNPAPAPAPSKLNLNVPSPSAPSTVSFALQNPNSLVLAVPRPANGQPPQSMKVDIADASSRNPVVKVLTPGNPNAYNVQIQPGSTARISAGVIAGQRTNFVEPVYPPDAKKAKINGTVVLHVIIGKDGVIKTLDVASSTNPIFNNSALEAVKQWTYRPYLINGDPTAVDTTITVNYALNH
jgi:protein TonB